MQGAYDGITARSKLIEEDRCQGGLLDYVVSQVRPKRKFEGSRTTVTVLVLDPRSPLGM